MSEDSAKQPTLLQVGGQRLRVLRRAMGLTQEALGAIIGCHRTVITRFETEGRPPERDNIVALAVFFGVPVEFLTGQADAEAENPAEYARYGALLAAFRRLPKEEQRAYEIMLHSRPKRKNDPAA